MLYLIPSWLGQSSSILLFSNQQQEIIKNIQHYIVENEKSTRKFLKFIFPEIDQKKINFSTFNKHHNLTNISNVLNLLKNGIKIGLLSEFGMPCIADPGNLVVQFCHNHSIKVIPISGPCSIFLALSASGLNGQMFTFHGYLPIEKKKLKNKINQLEYESKKNKSSQIFIETPFRNNQLFKFLLKNLFYSTLLCIATDITLPFELIQTYSIEKWKKKLIDLDKKPTIFILQSN